MAVPHGTKLNQLRALVRKHRAEIQGDTVGAAAAKATDTAKAESGKAWGGVASGWEWAVDQVKIGADAAWKKAEEVVAGRHKEL